MELEHKKIKQEATFWGVKELWKVGCTVWEVHEKMEYAPSMEGKYFDNEEEAILYFESLE